MRGVPDLPSALRSSMIKRDSPPAEGITMGDITLDNKPSLLLQVPDDLAVGLLDVDTLVLWDLGCESTSLINGTRRDLVLGDDLVS
jgi:hypothetical protein